MTGDPFDYLTLPNGLQRVSLDAPDPTVIELDVIAMSLARQYRFGGLTRRPFTVAEHSVLVSMLVDDRYAIAGLLHDAAEAFLGDIPTPIKRRLSGFKDLEGRFLRAVFDRFGVSLRDLEHIGPADDRALHLEAALLFDQAPSWCEPPQGVELQVADDPAGLFFERALELGVS